MESLRNKAYRLLRRSEKIFKTDMVYLAKGGSWLFLGQAISSISALLLAIAFANLVTPEIYGTYKYILSLVGIFTIFTLPGLNIAVRRAVAQGHEEVVRVATRSRILFSILGSAIALLGGLYYFVNNNTNLALGLWIIAATLPFLDTFTLYLSYLGGKRRFDLETKYSAITHLVSTLILIFVLWLSKNLVFIILAYLIPLSIMRIVFYIHTTNSLPTNAKDEKTQQKVLTYGKHLTLIGILGIIATNIDKLLLWKFLGPLQLAIYSFAIAVPEQIKGPMKNIGELAFPKFASQTPEQIKNNLPVFWRKLTYFGSFLLATAIAYAFFAPILFKFIFPQYIESVIYSQVFAFSIVVATGAVAFKILEAQGKTREQYDISITQHLIQILLYSILIPFYGIWGAIFASMLGKMIMIGRTILLIKKAFK